MSMRSYMLILLLMSISLALTCAISLMLLTHWDSSRMAMALEMGFTPAPPVHRLLSFDIPNDYVIPRALHRASLLYSDPIDLGRQHSANSPQCRLYSRDTIRLRLHYLVHCEDIHSDICRTDNPQLCDQSPAHTCAPSPGFSHSSPKRRHVHEQSLGSLAM